MCQKNIEICQQKAENIPQIDFVNMEMQVKHVLALNDTHSAFGWKTLNVNITMFHWL